MGETKEIERWVKWMNDLDGWGWFLDRCRCVCMPCTNASSSLCLFCSSFLCWSPFWSALRVHPWFNPSITLPRLLRNNWWDLFVATRRSSHCPSSPVRINWNRNISIRSISVFGWRCDRWPRAMVRFLARELSALDCDSRGISSNIECQHHGERAFVDAENLHSSTNCALSTKGLSACSLKSERRRRID